MIDAAKYAGAFLESRQRFYRSKFCPYWPSVDARANRINHSFHDVNFMYSG
jgi:hypothetical protein